MHVCVQTKPGRASLALLLFDTAAVAGDVKRLFERNDWKGSLEICVLFRRDGWNKGQRTAGLRQSRGGALTWTQRRRGRRGLRC